MITVKLFGEGCYIHLLESRPKSLKIYEAIAEKMKSPISEALLDLHFFQILNSNIHSIDELIIDSFGGLLPISPAYIEIWFQRKKAAKIPLQELITSSTLFPLYNVHKIIFQKHQFEKGIYLKETVIGCIGVYKLDIKVFDINLLSFTILESFFTKYPLLINFTYQENIFLKLKEDCLTKHQEIIIL